MEEAEAAEKKGHMGDFYRNILRNNVAFGTARCADACWGLLGLSCWRRWGCLAGWLVGAERVPGECGFGLLCQGQGGAWLAGAERVQARPLC